MQIRVISSADAFEIVGISTINSLKFLFDSEAIHFLNISRFKTKVLKQDLISCLISIIYALITFSKYLNYQMLANGYYKR